MADSCSAVEVSAEAEKGSLGRTHEWLFVILRGV